MSTVLAWLDKALTFAHGVMVKHFVQVQDNPATGTHNCADAIRAAAQISAYGKAKICADRGGVPDVVGLATEEVVALAATPHWDATLRRTSTSAITLPHGPRSWQRSDGASSSGKWRLDFVAFGMRSR